MDFDIKAVLQTTLGDGYQSQQHNQTVIAGNLPTKRGN